MSQSLDQILSRVAEVFRNELKQPALSVTLETVAKDVDGWDSLNHMVLVHAVEAEFKIQFKLPEILKFKNVGDMCRVLEKRLNS